MSADDQEVFGALAESVAELVPAHANPMACAKSMYSVTQENPDVGFDIAINAEAHSAFEFPRGLSVSMHQDSPVQIDLMKRTPVTALVVCDLGTHTADGKTPLSKQFFRDPQNVQLLRSAVAQYAPLAAHDLAATPETEHWEAELGKRGWVAVQMTKSRGAGTSRTTRFHLAVRATAGALDQEYYDWIKGKMTGGSDTSLTIGALAAHPYTERVKRVAQRNACRIAYQAARALRLRVQAQRDTESVYANSREFDAPLMAVPQHVQLSNVISVEAATKTATVHSHTTPVSSLVGEALVLFGPHEGMGKFALPASEWGEQHERVLTYPVGVRKNLNDAQATVEGEAPAYFVPSVEHAQLPLKYQVSDRYALPSEAVVRQLSNKTNHFTHYKPVAVLGADSSYERPLGASA